DDGRGALHVDVVCPSAWKHWQPDEYEIGLLRFALTGNGPHISHLNVAQATVWRAGTPAPFKALDGVVFQDAPERNGFAARSGPAGPLGEATAAGAAAEAPITPI